MNNDSKAIFLAILKLDTMLRKERLEKSFKYLAENKEAVDNKKRLAEWGIEDVIELKH